MSKMQNFLILPKNIMNKKQLIKSLERRGFSPYILKAFKDIKRENFVPKPYKKYAYGDYALPLKTSMQTISQPLTIAIMLSLLELKALKPKKPKILEIGSGSGYVLALINKIIPNAKLFGIEIDKPVYEQSKINLKDNENITILNMNGKNGLIGEKPFDRILVSASYEKLPLHLTAQLKEGGIIVSPVQESIFKIQKNKGKIQVQESYGFIFVPIID